MKDYLIVKNGDRHSIGCEFFSQDIIELYPLDEFVYDECSAIEYYTYIKGIADGLEGAFPICEFEDGVYLGVVGVLAIMDDEVTLTIADEPREIADAICRDCYEYEKPKAVQWARLMQIVEENDNDNELFEKIVDFVDNEIN